MKMTRSRIAARGALAVALTAVSLFLFRGTTNLVNAWAVPFILWILLDSLPCKGRIAASAAFLLMIIVVHPLQIGFALVYLGLSQLLYWRSLLPVVLGWWGFWLATWLGFATAVAVTDKLFGIPLIAITLGLGGGTWLGFWLVLAVQAGATTLAFIASTAIGTRIKNTI